MALLRPIWGWIWGWGCLIRVPAYLQSAHDIRQLSIEAHVHDGADDLRKEHAQPGVSPWARFRANHCRFCCPGVPPAALVRGCCFLPAFTCAT